MTRDGIHGCVLLYTSVCCYVLRVPHCVWLCVGLHVVYIALLLCGMLSCASV